MLDGECSWLSTSTKIWKCNLSLSRNVRAIIALVTGKNKNGPFHMSLHNVAHSWLHVFIFRVPRHHKEAYKMYTNILQPPAHTISHFAYIGRLPSLIDRGCWQDVKHSKPNQTLSQTFNTEINHLVFCLKDFNYFHDFVKMTCLCWRTDNALLNLFIFAHRYIWSVVLTELEEILNLSGVQMLL